MEDLLMNAASYDIPVLKYPDRIKKKTMKNLETGAIC